MVSRFHQSESRRGRPDWIAGISAFANPASRAGGGELSEFGEFPISSPASPRWRPA
ncbi:hypothetical protein ACCAA_570017 [Candidatus Accumulibacter aalborgensis]|uniref:Uncharacterized protein n=1 Tax=Candidatus Accumulibacter aalborgensis TaxID=1860102 RepID=A0A1A8XUK1_9PROT|nr:hypothetical protein ACCAA_570017 [Candidatus Accumulibacter aalborgensis]